MLVAHAVELAPQFQGRSAAAHHASGAVSLSAEMIGSPIADARRDVDTEADLAAAIDLGVGPATNALIDHGRGSLGRYELITATEWRNADGEPLAVTARDANHAPGRSSWRRASTRPSGPASACSGS